MFEKNIAEYNIGKNLDELACMDPRGYGVCRILCDAARKAVNGSFSIAAAKELDKRLEAGDIVYFLTGFVLHPYGKAETDGICGTLMLARALSMAYDVFPVIFCPEDAGPGIRALSEKLGFRVGHLEDAKEYEQVMFLAQEDFAKDTEDAKDQVAYLMKQRMPKACITVEAPGANGMGSYHNAVGISVSCYEAKMDLLFEALQKAGVYTLSIGDLGNEIGMGKLSETILRYIPYTGKTECKCDCAGGILSRTCADSVVVGTTSDWGAYALAGAVAYIKEYNDLMPDPELVESIIKAEGQYELIDMRGEAIPAVDGFDLETNTMIAGLMKKLVDNQREQALLGQKWFTAVAKKGYYDEKKD